MKHPIQFCYGVALALLMLLSWPLAYLVSRTEGTPHHPSQAYHWNDVRRHVVASPEASIPDGSLAVRLGIDPHYPPFVGRNTP
ncbi:MAG: hypothetical protein HQL86_03640 [Magnetococcales bacterium]|nr:hypothetical protein [Magnetococcales bacterium]